MAWGRLALIEGADDGQVLDKLANVFGYVRKPEKQLGITMTAQPPGITADISFGLSNSAEATTPKRPPARFLRINKIINAEVDPNNDIEPGYLSDPNRRLQASPGTYRFDPPPALMPMARLLPLLFNSLAQTKSGHRLNYRQLVKRISQGKALQHFPKQQRQRWPQRLQIIVDASPRLEPFWADFEAIVKHLQTLLGDEAVEALCFEKESLGEADCYCLPWPEAEHAHWRIWQVPPSDVSVLILSDLGVGDSRASVTWRRQLAALQQHPSPVLTLSPASETATDKLFCQQFKPTAFNDAYPLPRHPQRTGFNINQASETDIEAVLTWLSPLPLVDTGLLRRLRLAMQWGDSALETRIWTHPAMRDIGLGIGIQPSLADQYQQRYSQEFAMHEKATLFWETVTEHHKNAYQGLQKLEKFKQRFLHDQEDDGIWEYFQRLCATGKQSAKHPAQQQALRMQCRTVLASMPASIWQSKLSELAYHLYAIGYEDDIRAGKWPAELPAGFNPERLQWVLPSTAEQDQEKQWWHIVQVGDQGQIKCEPITTDHAPSVIPLKLELAKAISPRLTVIDTHGAVTHLQNQGYALTLAAGLSAELASGGYIVALDTIQRPSWASRIWRNAEGLWCSIPWLNQNLEVFWQISHSEANGTWRWPAPFGEDGFGLFVDLSVNNVTQRFRWLDPGNFWMGSPEDEPEREWNGVEEGKGTETRHQVTLSQGFWLADTAVSQAFWLAVMGDNPSKFKDNLENPVEKVSWQDAQVFIEKLNSLLPGLSAKLPSEAQWEFACRAGTTTPFSFGMNITPEQVNYNGKYPYANGEVGEYREQTVPVQSLPANPWGLYEMHGNVFEWCADVWQQQMSAEPVTDPLAIGSDEGAARVVRGGSWISYGRFVRSADRGRYAPDERNYFLGFRLALGHAELRSSQAVARGEGSGRRVAEQRQNGHSPLAAGEPQANWLEKLKKPFTKQTKKKK